LNTGVSASLLPWIHIFSQNPLGKTCLRYARSTAISLVGVARHFEWPRRRLNLPARRPVDPFSASEASRIRVIPVEPAHTFKRPLPALPEDLEVRPYFHEHSVEYSGTQYVSVLTEGSAWGCAHGAVFTCLGEFIPTFARDPWGADLHEVWRQPYLPAPKRLKGRALYLVTPEAADNFHHWMLDLLPRIGLVEMAGFAASSFDHVIVNHAGRRYQLETLAEFGIDPAKIIQLGSGDRVQPDELVVPSLKVDNQAMPLNQLHWLRSKFGPKTPPPSGRRLYLSRADAPSRRLLNEPDVFRLFEREGFENVTLSKLSVREQAELFASASIVAGPSGAAFTNIAFCSPGTRIIEFASPKWLTVDHWMLSARLGLDHTVIVGEGAPPSGRSLDIKGRFADITIDLDKVRRAITKFSIPISDL
jgi:hypothetical protein